MAPALLGLAEQERHLRDARRIAVLGIKPEDRAGQPAADIPAYLQRAGYEVVPVPTYYPEVTEILGIPVVRSLGELEPGSVDILDIFRKPSDIPGHVEEILALKPGVAWFQSGCLDPESADRIEAAGIPVVHACIYVVHRGMG